VLDRDGEVTGQFGAMLGSYETFQTAAPVVNPDSSMRFRVPRGQYNLAAEVRAADDAVDFVVMPWLEVSADRSVTLDARTTRPVAATVSRPGAALATSVTGFVALTGDGGFGAGWVDTAGVTRTAQLGPDAPVDRFFGGFQAVLAEPGADGTFTDSPYVYQLSWFTPGKAYTGSRRVADAELATVRTENLPGRPGDVAAKGSIATSTRSPLVSFPGTRLLSMGLPHDQEELFTTEDVTWLTVFLLNAGDNPGDPSGAESTQEVPKRTYQAGRHYTQRWHGAVFGPSLPAVPTGSTWANQVGTRSLALRVPLFGSTADTAGYSRVDSARTVVYRDGAKVCWSDALTCELQGVAPKGRYRVETSASRGRAETSTRVDVAWEVDHDGTPALPLQVVRFSPALDASNSAPGGQAFTVPVSVRRNPGSAPATVASLTVEVSYDDGAQWTPVRVVGGRARLHHAAGGHVSLRAKATDTAGNTVQQTIIRAYHLR
jgi:hypothetical protein